MKEKTIGVVKSLNTEKLQQTLYLTMKLRSITINNIRNKL